MEAKVELSGHKGINEAPLNVGSASEVLSRSRGGMFDSHELLENGIATFVDVSSIMVAYAIGMHQASLLLGIAYGFLDAFVVIWMRKPFARAVRWFTRGLRSRPLRNTSTPAIPA